MLGVVVVGIFTEAILPRLPLCGAKVVLDSTFFIKDLRCFTKKKIEYRLQHKANLAIHLIFCNRYCSRSPQQKE